MGGGEGELKGLEPVSPGAPLNNHLVVVATDGVDRFAMGRPNVRVGCIRGLFSVCMVLRTDEFLLGEELENRKRAGFCGLREDVADEEEGIFVGVVPDRVQ